MRQSYAYIVLFSLAASGCLQHARAGEDASLVICEYDQGPCKLRDLKEIFDGPYQGLRLWFGSQLTVKCSFHSFAHRDYPQLTWIDSNRIAVNENSKKPRFYAHHVAFLGTDGSLIACCGDALTSKPTITKTEGRSLVMQIPRGYHSEIAQYKSAYYESEVAIGTQASNSLPRNLDTAKDRPLIDARHRPLFESLPKGVHAYTVDGVCNPVNAPIPRRGKEEVLDPPVAIGTGSTSQARLHFRATDDKGLVIYYSLKNNANTAALQYLYIAFFGEDGALIASNSLKCKIGPHAVTPFVSIDGVPQPDATAYSTLLPMLLPQGHHKSITNFKLTMYVYRSEAKLP